MITLRMSEKKLIARAIKTQTEDKKINKDRNQQDEDTFNLSMDVMCVFLA